MLQDENQHAESRRTQPSNLSVRVLKDNNLLKSIRQAATSIHGQTTKFLTLIEPLAILLVVKDMRNRSNVRSHIDTVYFSLALVEDGFEMLVDNANILTKQQKSHLVGGLIFKVDYTESGQ